MPECLYCGHILPESKKASAKFCDEDHKSAYHRDIYMAGLSTVREQDKKKNGMKISAERFPAHLAMFREIARDLAKDGRHITIDNVRDAVLSRGIKFEVANYLGSVFKGKEWSCEGFAVSTHEGSHGRMVRVWRLNR